MNGCVVCSSNIAWDVPGYSFSKHNFIVCLFVCLASWLVGWHIVNIGHCASWQATRVGVPVCDIICQLTCK